MSFPETFIRGVNKTGHITDEGGVRPEAFDPYTPEPRDDGAKEISINWEDDEGVMAFTLEQRTEKGHLAFQAGAVRVRREVIEWINRSPMARNMLGYERQPLEGNIYHGNILVLHPQPSKATLRLIQGTLALHGILRRE